MHRHPPRSAQWYVIILQPAWPLVDRALYLLREATAQPCEHDPNQSFDGVRVKKERDRGTESCHSYARLRQAGRRLNLTANSTLLILRALPIVSVGITREHLNALLVSKGGAQTGVVLNFD